MATMDPDSRRTLTFTHVFTSHNEGNLLDHYKVDCKKLGEGSYGQVTTGTHKVSGQVRAIKSIDSSRIADMSRFEAEVTIQQELDHPNIVRLYEVFRDSRKFYLVMELCQGGELFDAIIAAGSFTEQKAATCMKQILGAIHYLHTKNFVHRDIKPENFLLQRKEENSPIKVIDFGLARRFQIGSSDRMLTKAGTPYYVAPQVLLPGGYDHKCDIWACGVLTYILLCGYPPFSGNNDNEILKRVKAGKFEFPEEDWGVISSHGRDIVSKMLTFDPIARPAAEALLQHSWIDSHARKPEGGSGVVSDLSSKLRNFRGHSKMKRLALTVIAQQLPDHDIEELMKTFQMLDKNSDGTLTTKEIRDGMKRHSVQIPQDLEEIMRVVDSDGSGCIDYSEFIAATLTTKQYLKREVMWAAFRTFDVNGDQMIEVEELQQVMKEQNNDVIEQLIKEVDADGNGKICFDEFCKMMEREALPMINKASNSSNKVAAAATSRRSSASGGKTSAAPKASSRNSVAVPPSPRRVASDTSQISKAGGDAREKESRIPSREASSQRMNLSATAPVPTRPSGNPSSPGSRRPSGASTLRTTSGRQPSNVSTTAPSPRSSPRATSRASS
mmetsp:Transcript_47911/g.113864  ORF Transcript_47911/g.113864 Transcript_47911/m.113864 type:complete len:612 (+) Transcript_47911:62-1897(+)